MRLFDSRGTDTAYENWLTTTPADRGHSPECECPFCHDGHVRDGDVLDNSVKPDFQCCKEEIELRGES